MLRGLKVWVVGSALAAAALAWATTASAQEAPKPVLTLDGDAAVITVLIKPDKTADFETVVAKLKEALEKNEKPERKQQLAGLKFFKSSQKDANGNAIYIFFVDPVVKNQEYDITRLIAEVFPVEVQELFNKYKDAFAGRGISVLTKIQ